MKRLIFLLVATLLMFSSALYADSSGGEDRDGGLEQVGGGACPNANVFTNVFTQTCWSCFLNDLNFFGIGRKPDGAAGSAPVCSCLDEAGVPEVGFPMGFWSPVKVKEVVTQPYCMPGLGGVKLMNTITGLGGSYSHDGKGGNLREFYHVHTYAFPLMQIIEMMVVPNCSTGYYDFDLLAISEINPLYNNDLLSLIMSPDAIMFANPIAKMWCAEDCVSTTMNDQKETAYGCAGCDGSLYPLTGNIYQNGDIVASSSLIVQRSLALSHRAGVERRTIGNAARCEPKYAFHIPRSQYKISMMYPVPQASESGGVISEGESLYDDDANFSEALAGSGEPIEPLTECCQPMGMSTLRWCTPVGGRTGTGNTFLYMLWQYRDCCVI